MSFTATPAGGTFVAGVLQLELRPDAVAEPTTISVSTQADSEFDQLPATAVYTLEPSGLHFSTPVLAQLASPPTLGPNEEVAVYLSTRPGEQELLPSQQHGGYLAFEIPHFSKLAPTIICKAAERTPPGCGDKGNPCRIEISESRYPQTARHVREVIAKYPELKSLQLPEIASENETDDDRKTASDLRRSLAMRAYAAARKGSASHCCLARDEYPLAMTAQGGACAHVRLIDFSDNSGSGSCIEKRVASLNPGEWFELEFIADKNAVRECKHLPTLSEEEKQRYTELTAMSDDFYRRDGCPADMNESGGTRGMDGSSGKTVKGRFQYLGSDNDEWYETPTDACRDLLTSQVGPGVKFEPAELPEAEQGELGSVDLDHVACNYEWMGEARSLHVQRKVRCPENATASRVMTQQRLSQDCTCRDGYRAQADVCVPETKP